MSSEKKEKKQHKMNFNIKEKLKKTFSKEHLKEVFTGEEQKKHLKQGSYSSIMTVIVLADRKSTRLNSSHLEQSRMPSSA